MSDTMGTSTASLDQSNTNGPDAQDEESLIKDKLIDLNQSILNELNRIVSDDPSVILTSTLRGMHRNYYDRHKDMVKKPSDIIADPFEEPNPTHAKHEGYCPLRIRQGDVNVLWPLSASVTELLGGVADLTDASQRDVFLAKLSNVLRNGEVLHELATRAVVRISSDTVVKISNIDNLTEVQNLHHIRQNVDVPVPMPLGVFSILNKSYAFTTFIPGITLEHIWTGLALPQKESIRDQLNVFFAKLRDIPLPSKDGQLGGGNPIQCRDNRRWSRTSNEPVKNVAEFHDFLLTEAGGYPGWASLLRSSLRDDYQVVMTHGDLHPRNIIVSNAEEVKIAGIIDWEYGGGYPEYWEYVTALRTAWMKGNVDWYMFLPEKAIGKFIDEKIKDCEIDRVVV